MLHHDCQPGEERGRPREWHSCGSGRSGYANKPRRESTAVARAERQALAEEAPVESARDPRLRAPERVEVIWRDGRQMKRLRVAGCWYVTLDLDAGIRASNPTRGVWCGVLSASKP